MLFERAMRCKLNMTFEEAKDLIEKQKQKAQYYKNNIGKDRTLIRYYTLTQIINGELYVSHESILDKYIRISNYPEGFFKSAKEIINLCEGQSWEVAYWYDEKTGDIVRASSDIAEAKKRIRQIFKDYPNIIVEFG